VPEKDFLNFNATKANWIPAGVRIVSWLFFRIRRSKVNLQDFFKAHPKAALAFSGGVDSAYLLYAAVRCGARVKAYFVKSQFQPEFELEDARKLAERLGVELEVIECDVLAEPAICENPKDRCYHCKKKIFSALQKAAEADGFDLMIDGTNASDSAEDRPGMKALTQMGVLSPLRLCGITKKEVRARSKEAGLFTWDKPAYACLATRMEPGEEITGEKLTAAEQAEKVLFSMGFRDFRVRRFHGAARIQVQKEQMEQAVRLREEIRAQLKPYFDTILLDLEER